MNELVMVYAQDKGKVPTHETLPPPQAHRLPIQSDLPRSFLPVPKITMVMGTCL